MYGANEFADAAFSGPVCAAGGLPVVEATLDGLPVVEATLDDAGVGDASRGLSGQGQK